MGEKATATSTSNVFCCAVCNDTFNSNKALIRHKTLHAKEKRTFNCNTCPKLFTEHREFVLHEITHLHHTSKHKCVECGVEKRYMEYKIHVLTHYEQPKQSCDVCGVLLTYDKMKEHTKVHSGFNTRFVCDICGKTLSTGKREMHMAIHRRGPKRYPCDYCDKVYKCKHDRDCHVNIHTGELSEICDICGFVCHNPKNMNRHKRKHKIIENRFECDYCQKIIFNKTSLVLHIRNHMLGFRCKCRNCSFSAPTRSALKRHKKLTHYFCKICRDGFHSSTQLARHVKSTNHQELMMENDE
ncbi:zinc finger protein 62 homolog [Amyelois transitella]|uniref:zinc finger protein 62 homolog n=1 Tax=Amyelois transitella TaxID=680683 RepID=UPI00298F8B32|nr:zinc finger protein 62 homolog [Amyelois transitella]